MATHFPKPAARHPSRGVKIRENPPQVPETPETLSFREKKRKRTPRKPLWLAGLTTTQVPRSEPCPMSRADVHVTVGCGCKVLHLDIARGIRLMEVYKLFIFGVRIGVRTT